MKLARTIRFDESDGNIFRVATEPDELAISGAFAFSNVSEADITGKVRQEFANGWLGLESFGRCTFVAVTRITDAENDRAVMRLAAHFVSDYGAPSLDAALPVAAEEVRYMLELCDEHKPNTLLVVERTLEEAGVREAFRVIETAEANIVDVIGPEAAEHASMVLKLDEK